MPGPSLQRAATVWLEHIQLPIAEQNFSLCAGIDPAVEKFKRDHKGNNETIVELNESEEGSKAGKVVSASEISLTSTDWEENQELAGFLRYPINETIKHKGYCTGVQSLMLLNDLMHNFCHPDAQFETLVNAFDA